jgi:hypothetical protein
VADWQPIETAPKDGTKILACNESGEIAVVHWAAIDNCGVKGWQISVVATDWNWYEFLIGATHWMVLPTVPKG